MIDIGLIDVIIPVSSLSAVALAVLSDKRSVRRWSPVAGIVGQPFWIWDTFFAQTWGIFVLSIAYLFVWLAGIYKYWWRKS